MVAAAAARLGTRFAALSAAVQRLQTAAVPVEPVPTAWTPVGAMAPVGLVESAAPAGLAPAVQAAPESVSSSAWVSVAAATVSVVGAPPAIPGRPARSTSAGSIKGGPPKAPRPRKGAQPQPAPASLPDVVVPVMVVDALTAAGSHADVPLADSLAVLDPTQALVAAPLTIEPVAVVAAVPFEGAPAKPRVIDPGQDPSVERARSTPAQRIGDEAERLAAIRLEALGWRIVARNLRVSRAEIDLLAIDPADPPMLVIVEVRQRNRRDFGLAEETVDFRKRAMLRRAAGELAMRPTLPDGRRLPALPVRVDLIAIDRGPDGRPSWRHHRGIET
jgi:putative endonuclease